jgi:hypothetical protein
MARRTTSFSSGRSHGGSAQADVLWRARSNFETSVALSASEATTDAFYYGSSGSSTVLVARLRQPVRSITTRVDYTMTTALSLQWYAQAYVSRGTYSDVRELADPRADRYADRFRPLVDSSVVTGRGVDFRQFRSNVVLRREYRPASTLFVVWTQGRDLAASEPGRLRLGPAMRGLFRLRPRNALAVKVAYWLRR